MNQYLSSLNPTERRFVIGVAMLLFVIINIFWIWPHFSDWGNLQSRLSKARQKLADYEAVIAQEPKLQREMKSLEGDSVPREDQATEFLGRIQNEAIRSGVNFTGSRRYYTRTNQFFIELIQPVTVDAGEKQLVDFLYNLGVGESLIRVRDLNIHPDPSRLKLSATITFVATFQKNLPTRGSRTAARPEAARPAPAPAQRAGNRSTAPPAQPRPANPPLTNRK